MRKRVVRIGLVCLVGALVGGPRPVHADFTVSPPSQSIVPDANGKLGLIQTDWRPGTAGITNPFVLQQFNPATYSSGGQTAVLTAVDVKVDYQFDNRLNLTFVNLATITVTATGSLNVFMPDGTTPLVPTSTFANSGSLTVNPAGMLMKTFFIPGPTDKEFRSFAGTQSATYTDAATLAKFTGSSTINLPSTATATSNFSTSSGNGFGSSFTLAGARISLVYHFVPEPSSLLLTGVGVVGFAVAARRRLTRTPEESLV